MAHVALAQVPETVPSFDTPPIIDSPLSIAHAGVTEQTVLTVADATPVDAAEPDPVDAREVECVAKVVVHEAGNQPQLGQVAVAQVIRTRMKDRRFARTACGVVKQRGQFFDVDAYNPPRNSARWINAVDIATDTLNGTLDDVAAGALFFHSAGASMPGRVRVTKIGGHTFYR